MKRGAVRITTFLVLLAVLFSAHSGYSQVASEVHRLGATELPGLRHVPFPGIDYDQLPHRERCEDHPLTWSPDPRSDLWFADRIANFVFGECE